MTHRRPDTIQNVDAWEGKHADLLVACARDEKAMRHPLAPFVASIASLLVIIAGELIKIRIQTSQKGTNDAKS